MRLERQEAVAVKFAGVLRKASTASYSYANYSAALTFVLNSSIACRCSMSGVLCASGCKGKNLFL